jgi:hypothetical protein
MQLGSSLWGNGCDLFMATNTAALVIGKQDASIAKLLFQHLVLGA